MMMLYRGLTPEVFWLSSAVEDLKLNTVEQVEHSRYCSIARVTSSPHGIGGKNRMAAAEAKIGDFSRNRHTIPTYLGIRYKPRFLC
jgi:hypothetical protein